MLTEANVNLNLWLWLLTGRQGDFKAKTLNTPVRYYGAESSAEILALRSALGLSDARTDLPVRALMSAAMEWRGLLAALPPNTGTLHLPHELHRSAVYGAAVSPYDVGGAFVALSDASCRLPGVVDMTITPEHTVNGRQLDVERVSESSVRYPELRPLGVNASFNRQSGEDLRLVLYAFSYPYSAAWDAVAPQAEQLLSSERIDLPDILSPRLKLGALSAVIMREEARHKATVTAAFLPAPGSVAVADYTDGALMLGGRLIVLNGSPLLFHP